MSLGYKRTIIRDIGMLDRKVQIQRLQTVVDESGDERGQWKTIDGGNVWAHIDYLSGRVSGAEVLVAGQIESDVNVVVTIRHMKDVRASDRIYVESNKRYLQVEIIADPHLDHQYLVLNCIDRGSQDEEADQW